MLRDGKLVGVEPVAKLDHKAVINMMFGNVEVKTRPEDLTVQEETVLEVRGLTRKDKFENVSFRLRRGEVLGIAGMLGSGRTELLRCIFGADPYCHGEVCVEGERVDPKANPVAMKRLGVGLTPEERKSQGVILIHSVRDNLCYAAWTKFPTAM